uniref:NAC domain-containing protein n=1 Tax=Zea mays TaxID=4577 RepID=B8A2S0_MAIZE|nr:unknown [Zea mays]|eukprot:NP_001146652.1 putative NAC domain transcription factor superfamily protein [Zea mays]
MTGTTWIIDSQRFATKIKNASGSSDPSKQKWIGNPSKECPKCSHVIDNSDVVHQWPGLPKGVKFDPSDQELIWHLMAKHGKSGIKPHPFIDEFIPTVEEDEGICYTHPQKLPGVKQNGSVSHFFHRTFKAYNTGTRKRRRINTDDADVRWHKTGNTKPVLVDGKHLGCKKIMVLYISPLKGGKAEKTNWVIHQYHLGTGEDERDGEYVVSKIFFQQQFKPRDKNAQELTTSDDLESMAAESNLPDFTTLPTDKHVGTVQEVVHNPEHNLYQLNRNCEINIEETVVLPPSVKTTKDGDNLQSQDQKLWEGDSQFELLDSQQLAEGLALCDEFLLSQSQTSCGGGDEPRETKPCLAAYAHLSAEDFKKDLEECQRLEPTDNTNLELDNTDEFRLSQIEFSQDSFMTWAAEKITDD